MPYFDPSFKKVSSWKPEFIHQGNWPVRRDSVTIEKGQVLNAGSILGKKTESQKCVLSAAKAADETAIADGSEKPYAILQVDVDATTKDIVAPVYLAGAFLGLDLTVGNGHTLEGIKDELRLLSIYIEKGED
ncbi:head decoration protein [Oligoflexus tunisiensis]|uniref:head decoration protein n=1 Tax=Oligoflexus tunisiensis TaxID=708132 RepID=UPI001C404FD7|nr:head decoration protein [Oligoflexus tunisiensis]